MTKDKFLLNVFEAAEKLSIGRSTLLTMAYEGSIPSLKVGRRRLFPVAEIEAWIVAKQAPVPQKTLETGRFSEGNELSVQGIGRTLGR